IANHQAIDALRRAATRAAVSLDQHIECGARAEVDAVIERLATTHGEPLDELIARERRRLVEDAVAEFSELHRQALILAYYNRLSYAEIAEFLGIPVGTVKSRLHTAIPRLGDAARAARLAS